MHFPSARFFSSHSTVRKNSAVEDELNREAVGPSSPRTRFPSPTQRRRRISCAVSDLVATKRPELFPAQAQDTFHHQWNFSLSTLESHLWEAATIDADTIPLAERRGNWVQKFREKEDGSTFVSAQFFRYQEVERFIEENFKDGRPLRRQEGTA